MNAQAAYHDLLRRNKTKHADTRGAAGSADRNGNQLALLNRAG